MQAIARPGTLPLGDHEIDCRAGGVIVGLHDHHVHLLAMARATESVDARGGLDEAITAASGRVDAQGWIRVVGYDDALDGPLDRWRLDALAPGRAVRVQHRSGSMWVLSSVGLERVRALAEPSQDVERNARGELTGRLFRLDDWLDRRITRTAPPDLAAVGTRLASFGVTGVTDATPTESLEYFETLAAAVRSGDLPLHVAVTGGAALCALRHFDGLALGPVKIVIADHVLPEFGDLVETMLAAHGAGRAVAVHAVTRTALVLALAAFGDAGTRVGDRIEHASLTPPELVAPLVDLGLTVVTQPAFVLARGDSYLREVDQADRSDLYRCASLIDAGVQVAASSDAPFGPRGPVGRTWIGHPAPIPKRRQRRR